MMSLWHPDGALMVQGDANSPYSGFDRLRAFWLSSGPFTHRRFSLVPSFKIQIDARGNRAFLYFECHDVGNFATGSFDDATIKTIVNDTFLAGTLRNIDGNWLFSDMTAGPSSPLSYDTYYYPTP